MRSRRLEGADGRKGADGATRPRRPLRRGSVDHRGSAGRHERGRPARGGGEPGPERVEGDPARARTRAAPSTSGVGV